MSIRPSQGGGAHSAKIFITYRREETGPYAGRLYDALVSRFGETNVFMDVEMAPGEDFVERITEAVSACHALIVVMGPNWATATDEQGNVRLDDPDDFVRLEVQTALRRPDVTPIPVLVAGARMPKGDDLPEPVRSITRRNALELSNVRWRQDVGRLISALEELLEERALARDEASHESVIAHSPISKAADDAREHRPPTSAAAASPPAELRRPAEAAGSRRRVRRTLIAAALAFAAIVVVVVIAVGGGGSSIPEGEFKGIPLSELVLPKGPGNLLINANESGDGYADDLEKLSSLPDPQGAYHTTFTPSGDETPYTYSYASAAVFENESGARTALDDLRAEWVGGYKYKPVGGLGDAGAVFENTKSEPEFIYAWQTGELLQVFDLVWAEPPASAKTARGFADEMNALVP
jgi:hypothetical protein